MQVSNAAGEAMNEPDEVCDQIRVEQTVRGVCGSLLEDLVSRCVTTSPNPGCCRPPTTRG